MHNSTPDSAVHSNTATLDQADEALRCPKCDALWHGRDAWCHDCGFYPSLGSTVDVDHHTPAPARSGLAVVPCWCWSLAAALVLVIGGSVAARFLIEPDSENRFYASVGLAAIGAGLFFLMHCSAYLHAIVNNASLTILDFLLKPIAVWKETFRELPGTGNRVVLASTGLAGCLCGLFVVGGIAWSRLWEDKPPPRKVKSNLLQSVVEQARQAEGGADNLEDAVKDFAGDAEKKEAEKKEKERDAALPRVECLIIGYRASTSGEIAQLLLAAPVQGKLRYVGSVRNIPDDVQERLQERVLVYASDRPFLPDTNEVNVSWLKPGLACLVKHERFTSSNRLTNPKFESLLVELRVD